MPFSVQKSNKNPQQYIPLHWIEENNSLNSQYKTSPFRASKLAKNEKKEEERKLGEETLTGEEVERAVSFQNMTKRDKTTNTVEKEDGAAQICKP